MVVVLEAEVKRRKGKTPTSPGKSEVGVVVEILLVASI